MSSTLRMAARVINALLSFILQSLIVLAASGAAAPPLSQALRWFARYAHVPAIHRMLLGAVEHPLWFGSGLWVLAQLCLSLHALRALRHERGEVSWMVLVTPLLMVAWAGGGMLVLAAMATFVSNTARVFLSEPASLWSGLIAAALLGVWLLQIGFAGQPRRPGWRHK